MGGITPALAVVEKSGVMIRKKVGIQSVAVANLNHNIHDIDIVPGVYLYIVFHLCDNYNEKCKTFI